MNASMTIARPGDLQPEATLVPGEPKEIFQPETFDRLGNWLAEQPGRTWDLWTHNGAFRAQVNQGAALGFDGETGDAFGRGETSDAAMTAAIDSFERYAARKANRVARLEAV